MPSTIARKAACREANLVFLRRATYRLWEDSAEEKLRCDWCELMGRTGYLTRELLLHEAVIDSSPVRGHRYQ